MQKFDIWTMYKIFFKKDVFSIFHNRPGPCLSFLDQVLVCWLYNRLDKLFLTYANLGSSFSWFHSKIHEYMQDRSVVILIQKSKSTQTTQGPFSPIV